jgi:flagellin-like protein
MFKSKKAMSPLIATVLLIAFAVALGALIINWSSSIVSTECQFSLELNSKSTCINGNIVKLGIINNQENPLTEIEVIPTFETADGNEKCGTETIIVNNLEQCSN